MQPLFHSERHPSGEQSQPPSSRNSLTSYWFLHSSQDTRISGDSQNSPNSTQSMSRSCVSFSSATFLVRPGRRLRIISTVRIRSSSTATGTRRRTLRVTPPRTTSSPFPRGSSLVCRGRPVRRLTTVSPPRRRPHRRGHTSR